MNNYLLKEYTEKDKDDVAKIFNYYVENSFAAYPERTIESGFLNQLLVDNKKYPKYVIEFQQTKIVGFGFSHRYNQANTFDKTLMLTYFIDKDHTRKGLGFNLLTEMENDCRNIGIEILLVQISSLNEASLHFHRKYGFKECGRFKNVGNKFGKDFDDVWMQKDIK